MTVVVRHPGAVTPGPWTNFTVGSLQSLDANDAIAYLNSENEFTQGAYAFGFAIPADATITSLTVEGRCAFFDGVSAPRWLWLDRWDIAAFHGSAAHVYVDADADASEWTIFQSEADPNVPMPTVAQLNSPTFTIVANAGRGAGADASVYLDYIVLTVEYDEYVPPEPPPVVPTVVTGGAYDITATSASPSGSVPADGGAAIVHYGFACSTAPNPRRGTAGADGDVDLLSWWSFPLTGLAPGTRYYVAAYAGNSAGDGWGADVTFVTLPVVPTVTTANAYDITATSATGGGMVWDRGGSAITHYGLACSTQPNPRVGTAGADGEMYAVGAQWTFPLTGLTPGTRYYVAAYAGNSAGDGWGPDTTFVTHGIPTVATAGIYDITADAASGGGNVISDGGEAVETRGVCWSVGENPTTAVNIIPAMTSATAPSGWASGSSCAGPGFEPCRAFDHLNGAGGVNAWIATGTTGWIGYQFPAAHVATRYAVTTLNGGATPRAPKTWTFQGSNDGAAWDTLDTQTNITDWATASNVRKVSDFANTTAYAYYRLDITASNDASYVGVGELEMMETADDDTLDGSGSGVFVSALTGLTEGITYNVRAYAVNVVGIAYGAAVIFTAIADAPPVEPPPGPPRDPSRNLLFDGTLELMVGTLDVAGSATQMKYSNSDPGGFGNLSFRLPFDPDALTLPVDTSIIPVMTSATAPSGVASASSFDPAGYFAWKAFDHANLRTERPWKTPVGSTTGWVQYQFPAAHVITRYAVTSRNTAAPNVHAPKTWTFAGSNDGAAWTTLDTQTNITDWAASPNVRKVFDFANSTAYAYYRLDVTAINGGLYVSVGELEMMAGALVAASPWGPFDAQVVKGAAVTMKHGLAGFAATLFEGEVTSDVSHATIAGGKAYYDVTCAGLWWKAGQRKDFSMVVGDDDYGQWYAMDDSAKVFQVSTDGCLEIRLAAGQSAAAGDSASLYYWLGKGMGDPAASIDCLLGLLTHDTRGANWHAEVSSALTPWGPWTTVASWGNGTVDGYPICFPITGTTPQALRFKLYTSGAVDALDVDRFIRLDKMSVGSGVSANGLSVVSAANPTVVTSTSAHGLRSGDRVFITQSSASTPTISGWRTVTVTDGAHFTVPVAVTTAGGAGTFYKATRIDQALVEIAVTTGLATLASLQPGGIGNLNWGLAVRPHASRAGGIDLLAATNVKPFDYGFWDNHTFHCKDRPVALRALHDYLIDSSLPGIDLDVRRATEDSPTVVKVLYKFRAEDGETSSYPDGTALAVYRDIDPATGLGRTYAGDWSDAAVVLDVWSEWADLSLTTAQAGDLGDQILAWLSANAYQGGGTIAPATLPLRGDGDVMVFSALGGVKTVDGTDTVHTFAESGVLECTGTIDSETLVVAGGGHGSGGGAGAGGYLTGTQTLTGTMPVTVGEGGQAGNIDGVNGANGADSVFGSRTAKAGGGGASAWGVAGPGGSGGGGHQSAGGAAAPSGQGNAGGGFAGHAGSPYPGGGGGGAGGPGGDATSDSVSGSGGPGVANDIVQRGSPVTYAEGGDGANYYAPTGNGADGAANTGSGGDGAGGTFAPGKGAKGIVVVRYPTPVVGSRSTKPVAYVRAGDYIEDSNLDTGPLMITGFSMDADRGIATLGIGENRRAFVERLTPDKA